MMKKANCKEIHLWPGLQTRSNLAVGQLPSELENLENRPPVEKNGVRKGKDAYYEKAMPDFIIVYDRRSFEKSLKIVR